MNVPASKVIATFTFYPGDYRIEPLPVIQMIGRDGHTPTNNINEALAAVILNQFGLALAVDPDEGRLGWLQ